MLTTAGMTRVAADSNRSLSRRRVPSGVDGGSGGVAGMRYDTVDGDYLGFCQGNCARGQEQVALKNGNLGVGTSTPRASRSPEMWTRGFCGSAASSSQSRA